MSTVATNLAATECILYWSKAVMKDMVYMGGGLR